MKRIIFIVLWTVIFAVMTSAAWRFAWTWLTSAGIATAWAQELIDRVEMIFYLTCGAVPLVGLLLGLFGRLPGTEIHEDEKS
jgi:hypothetical protein